jgi:hypothetical protein
MATQWVVKEDVDEGEVNSLETERQRRKRVELMR